MGSSPPESADTASPEFLAVFRAAADTEGRLPFDRFMALALYHPAVGYYRAPRRRVGYGPGTDFFTASTSGPVFGELVAAAAAETIRRHGGKPEDHTFVELGAEPDGGVLHGVEHPFRAARVLRLDEPRDLTGPCVVFSNELFDAQPFARYVRTASGWSEVVVCLAGSRLVEDLAPATRVDALRDIPLDDVPLGYRFDAPITAADLAGDLAREPWHGLFLAFDYGKAFATLAYDTPAGTARAYWRHRQSNDLLARPGEQDLTCHVCWDWIVQRLTAQRFAVDPVVAQERFLMERAAPLLARQIEADAIRLSRRKLALQQLLHPSHLGRKFQVLSAWRTPEDCPCTG